MPHSWYYKHGDESFGPVSSETLRQLAESGRLDCNDLVWRDGIPRWIAAHQVQGLFPTVTPDEHKGAVKRTSTASTSSVAARSEQSQSTPLPPILLETTSDLASSLLLVAKPALAQQDQAGTVAPLPLPLPASTAADASLLVATPALVQDDDAGTALLPLPLAMTAGDANETPLHVAKAALLKASASTAIPVQAKPATVGGPAVASQSAIEALPLDIGSIVPHRSLVTKGKPPIRRKTVSPLAWVAIGVAVLVILAVIVLIGNMSSNSADESSPQTVATQSGSRQTGPKTPASKSASTPAEPSSRSASMAEGPVRLKTLIRQIHLLKLSTDAGGEDLKGTPYDVLLGSKGFRVTLGEVKYKYIKNFNPITVAIVHLGSDGDVLFVELYAEVDFEHEEWGGTLTTMIDIVCDGLLPNTDARKFFKSKGGQMVGGVQQVFGKAVLIAHAGDGKVNMKVMMDLTQLKKPTPDKEASGSEQIPNPANPAAKATASTPATAAESNSSRQSVTQPALTPQRAADRPSLSSKPSNVPAPPVLAAMPDAAVQAEASKTIKEVYGDEWAAAKTPVLKHTLARKLLDKARDTKNDDAARFTLLKIARDIATQALDGPTAFEVIDTMAQSFQIDAFEMKADVLTKGASMVTAPLDHQAVARKAEDVSDEAFANDDFAVAKRLNELALDEERKGSDKALRERASERSAEIDDLAQAYEAANKATATLKKTPNDAEANLALGKYKCLVKGDWESGLALLALGIDKDLRAMAATDIAGAASPDDQTKIGDGWWNLAEAQKGTVKRQIKGRAGYWYEQALPGLSGLAKDKAEKRLSEIPTAYLKKANSSEPQPTTPAADQNVASEPPISSKAEENKPRLLQSKTQLFDNHPNYARSNGMSFDVGIGNEPWGVGVGAIGYELENISIVRTKATISGTLHRYDGNSFAGFIVDYHTPDGYSKRVRLSTGMYSTERGDNTPRWGKGANADQFVDLGNWRSGILKLKEWAPSGWDGRAWFSVLLENSGKNTSMTGRIDIPGLSK